ncbi:MAG: hypothetical protein A2010_10535 [Nitrospirae bacterium GWD2_57_9]|nr:MAG: hypothetical protein A2010_10535 [Nitrospirae bacterium GWD2_57_9]
MQSYIIRIYRREKHNLRKIVGIVEKVGEKGRQAFTQYDELWEILTDQDDAGRNLPKPGKNDR